MDTTTMQAFWQNFTTTTADTVVSNYPFFTGLLVSVIIMMCLGGLFYGFVNVFKSKRR